MEQPSYQEHKAEELPEYRSEDGNLYAKIVAGEVLGVKSPVRARTPTYFIDFTLKNGQSYEHAIPATWNVLIYNQQGEVAFNDNKKFILQDTCSFFKQNNEKTEKIKITAKEGTGESRFLLLAGEPINEKTFQRGPFVMNTPEEIQQTIEDYSQGKNGFEGAREWKSEIQAWRFKEDL